MGIISLGLYAALILFLSLRWHGKSSESSFFFINNRSSGALSVGLAIIVACVGASATIGMIGMAFSLGTPAFWWLGMGAAGLLILGVFLARTVRQTRAVTLPQIVESVLGKPVRPIVSIVIVVAWLAILAAQFVATQRIVTSLTGLSFAVCLSVSLLLIIGHTFYGGQATIMRIGTIQTIIIFGGLLTLLGWLTWHNPTWFSSVRLEPVNAQFPPGKLLYYGLIIGGSYLVCPMLFGRLLSARSSNAARWGAIIGAGGLVCTAVLMVSIGLACKGILPAGTPADAVLTTALSTVLPNWLNILISLGLLSAVVSSADACLITASSVLSRDLLQQRSTAACRVSIVLLGCAGAALSCLNKGIIDFLLMSYDVYVCGVVVPVLIGLLLSGKCKVNSRFASVAVLAGGLLGALSSFSGIIAWSYAGLAASFVITVLGCLDLRVGAAKPPASTWLPCKEKNSP